MLTKLGCNSGACHGAAIGRGGFRLSLLGYDPEADYEAIAWEYEGRRVNRVRPEASLLLLKPTLAVPHGGGRRLEQGSAALTRLLAWLEAGLPRGRVPAQGSLPRFGAGGDSGGVVGERRVIDLGVSPAATLLPRPGAGLRLRVVARYSDDSREDVTAWALYSSNDDAVATVDETGHVTTHRRGDTSIMVRYLGQVKAARVAVPMGNLPVSLAREPAAGFIDAKVYRQLERMRVPPSPLADDATFLRRVSLDLTGTLPTLEEARAFLADRRPTTDGGPVAGAGCGVRELAPAFSGGSLLPPQDGVERENDIGRRQQAAALESGSKLPHSTPGAEHPAPSTQHQIQEKRARLVDTLLDRPAFADFWTYKLGDLLRVNSRLLQAEGAAAYHGWLREQVARNRPFNEVARALLLGAGDAYQYGPANFARVAGDARGQAELVSQVFMGVRLQCAHCHKHPFDRWTQDDYHGLAAAFARLERGREVTVAPRGEVTHARTGKDALPRIPGGRWLPREGDRREPVAAWLAAPSNPYLARATVNRLWKEMMGRGLVEPIDDMRASNPPSHPELLDALARDFQAHGFDVKRTLRLIATSTTYQRSARALPGNRGDDRFYSHARVRLLPAPVLIDAVGAVTGVPEQYEGRPDGTRAIALGDSQVPSPPLDLFGRCSREATCSPAAGATDGLPQALHLLNGPLLNEKLKADAGNVARWAALDDRRRIPIRAPNATPGFAHRRAPLLQEIYLRALSRFPTAQETAHWTRVLDAAPDRRAALEDLVWAVLNSREFVFNH